MPRLLTRLPASHGLAATGHAVPSAVGRDVRVALPRMAPTTRRSVVLASFVLRSRHDFQMVRVHAGAVPAQVVGLHSSGNVDALEVEESEVRDPVPLPVDHDAVCVAVPRHASRPLPAAGVGDSDEPHELLRNAHVSQFTTGRHHA